MTTTYESPRINALKESLGNRDSEVLAKFWDEMGVRHTPLFEPIPDDETHILATFLWRGQSDTQHVLLFSAVVGFADDYCVNRMQLLEGTDVWYRTVPVRRDVRTTYYFSPNDPLKPASAYRSFSERIDYITHYRRTDPLNDRGTYDFPADEEVPGNLLTSRSVICGPDAVPHPYVVERPDVPKGEVTLHRFASKVMNNTRRVWFYTPPGYRTDGKPYAWLLLFDGWAYIKLIPTPMIMDNLVADGKIPPLVIVLVNSEGETRNTELPCNPDFAAFISEELVPWVRTQLHITADPTHSVVGGSSYGGLAASWLGFTHPEIFGNVLSQSGAYQWIKPDDPEPGWLIRQFVASERLPLRFYLDAGLLERNTRVQTGMSLLGVNRHFRNVLTAKGYPVTHIEFSGGHDHLWWQHTVAEGLIALLGNAT